MNNVTTKKQVLNDFLNSVEENVEANLSDLDFQDYMKEDKVDHIRAAVNKIKANMVKSIPDGVSIPELSLYISPTGTEDEGVSVIHVSVNNRLKNTKKFKFQYSACGSNITEQLVDFFKETYCVLITDGLAEQNLNVVNDVLKEACTAANLGYTISVVTALSQKGKKIAYISDEEIQFVADEDTVFELDDLLVLREPDEMVTEEMIENAKKELADSLASSQTTEQLVANHGGSLVQYICNINKHIKPMTLIKKVCNKNSEKLNGNKDTLAYFSKDNVFAIVARVEGKFELVLSPFDTETYRKAEFDVLKALAG